MLVRISPSALVRALRLLQLAERLELHTLGMLMAKKLELAH